MPAIYPFAVRPFLPAESPTTRRATTASDGPLRFIKSRSAYRESNAADVGRLRKFRAAMQRVIACSGCISGFGQQETFPGNVARTFRRRIHSASGRSICNGERCVVGFCRRSRLGRGQVVGRCFPAIRTSPVQGNRPRTPPTRTPDPYAQVSASTISAPHLPAVANAHQSLLLKRNANGTRLMRVVSP
ncbi:hypothetical protein LMG27174_06832 [Paraburkholderia rhynchosiae]|uniref:Uncharacterized protein n=1 Tax=Paraburkholderia rhynchosiae TaxID=487049 RepID=A0A6J5CQT9_9BURK|nr:hypothetical protein LMG27174_06832 [Paraburkholderia rhynchosiae]